MEKSPAVLGETPAITQSAVDLTPPGTKAAVEGLSFWYGGFQALKGIHLRVPERQITALIGPSGCGKSTLLRCFNRMHDLYRGARYEGRITLWPDGVNVVDRSVNAMEVRLRIGMVFQKPNPFPKTIFENVAYGLRIRGVGSRSDLSDRVEAALRGAALWDECKDRLRESALRLSGGQQQRLCIARVLATEPELVLFDEPTSALDPIATAKIEGLISAISEQTTVLIVTHNMQQAQRISQQTAFMYLGELAEVGPTDQVFTQPRSELTRRYISGQFG